MVVIGRESVRIINRRLVMCGSIAPQVSRSLDIGSIDDRIPRTSTIAVGNVVKNLSRKALRLAAEG